MVFVSDRSIRIHQHSKNLSIYIIIAVDNVFSCVVVDASRAFELLSRAAHRLQELHTGDKSFTEVIHDCFAQVVNAHELHIKANIPTVKIEETLSKFAC